MVAVPIKTYYVSLISLGCPRNLVDSEVMLGIIKKSGFEISDDTDKADIVIINTCGFIEDAKKESIDIILKAIRLKTDGVIKHVVVAGCLSQRYQKELSDEFAEVDAMLGTSDLKKIGSILHKICGGENKILNISSANTFLYDHTSPRVFLTPKHFAYLKISEGCIHKCSFCAIPSIRGPFRSRSFSSVIKEAKNLIKIKKVSEINIIGQDTTAYGLDLYKKRRIAGLLRKISDIDGKFWIRLLYTHPKFIDEDLLKVMKEKDKICKYIDLPVQHISTRILKLMRRGINKIEILRLIEKIRAFIPEAAIRTSVIVGFPTETEIEFKELLNFLKAARFERLGAFLYSPEEKTHAAIFKNQIPHKIKEERFRRVMELQQNISKENNKKFLNKTLDVIIDGKGDGPGLYIGRTYADAPEVDGEVYVTSKKPLRLGEFAKVFITGFMEYDLEGTVL